MTTFAEMSYDELSAYMESSACCPTRLADALGELDRKSGAMTAICKLAAELDAEGLVVVPKRPTYEMQYAVMDDLHRQGFDLDTVDVIDNVALFRAAIAAAPPASKETP